MAFVHIVDTAKVEILGHNATTLQPVVNVLHTRLSDANQTQVNLDNMAAAIEHVVGVLDITQWSLAYVHEGVRVTGLSSATAPQSTSTSAAGATGTGASAPTNACALTYLHTALRGRSYRGRCFISPIKATQVNDSNTLTSGARATFDVFFNDLTSALAALTPASKLVVASRKLGTSADVTSWATESEMASQRRRLKGR